MTAPAHFEIRIAEHADAEAIAHFAAQSFCDTFAHLYPPEDLAAHLAKNYNAALQAEELADPELRYWVARQDARLVGYAMAGPVDLAVTHAPHDRELYRLYVDASVKGAGVADALMREVLAWTAGALWLSVWENNTRAQGFYKRYGFEHMGEHKFMVGSVADRDFVWRRP